MNGQCRRGVVLHQRCEWGQTGHQGRRYLDLLRGLVRLTLALDFLYNVNVCQFGNGLGRVI